VVADYSYDGVRFESECGMKPPRAVLGAMDAGVGAVGVSAMEGVLSPDRDARRAGRRRDRPHLRDRSDCGVPYRNHMSGASRWTSSRSGICNLQLRDGRQQLELRLSTHRLPQQIAPLAASSTPATHSPQQPAGRRACGRHS